MTRALKTKAKAETATGGYLFLAPEETPDTDHPWWTLRFVDDPDEGLRRRLATRLAGIEGVRQGGTDLLLWDKYGRQCRFDPGKPAFESDRAWAQFYREVRRGFDALHMLAPLHAVMFQEQHGLPRMSDGQLATFAAQRSARAKAK